ncbi:uncharacterized protein LY89DRAFT_731841 [Mollisia scopiformis]|uniref:BTB domain-containing protein n=1 Tax=Mollisia scopiformis TaxID=149040 RepID=A0A194XH24_MOLSC|nr:uncharacterized protein LY89DRAFT_731841 [Mollisia scopiformis]KUJ19441.1 hypothetical protein LY89DRAFT_731841 [Mollisia scopiformis]
MSSASGSSSTSSEGTSAPTQVAHNPMEALQSSLASGKFSDLTITHGNQSWSAHRVVVCSQSSVLESMIMAAESPNILRLDKYDYEAVSMMMEYLYGSNYTTQDSAPHFSLPLHISIFNLAVDLSIPGLKSLAVLKFRYNLNNYVNEPTIFFAAVRSIYETTTRENPELRLATLDAGISELRNMLNGPHKPGFFRLTQEVPDFQAEIYLLMLENPTRPMEVMAPELCQECGPREEGDGYEVTTECKGCGEERTLAFY